MPRIEGLDQNTPEWVVQRVGCLTASHMAEVVGRYKPTKAQLAKGEAPDYLKARADYLMDVVIERLTGRATEHFCTQAMERGIETEPRARAAYEIETGCDVKDGGFWMHDSIEWFGASPDGLVGTDGLLEIKCPTTAVHLEYLEADVIPVEYAPQMLAQLCCTGRKWCDFVSFDDRLPASLQLFIRRFEPSPKLLEECEAEAKLFLEDVILKLGKLAERVQEKVLAD
jgi:putative phage-type endonuclease